ncbi:exported hypothetical protein [Candidatus Defluviicoccus seviourii]|uniref:GH16 domain-containing protein n=1 Tax=Candidatus Defluviicoccus seviourii TaxID=2565273 RepID=A0A564WD03_9PROT|nr:exported hypothetical protein [Candidatus Defluviicoccus seviourii]
MRATRMTMVRLAGAATLALGAFVAARTFAHAAPPLLDLSGYRLVWADEFDGPAAARPRPHWFFFDGWGKGKWRDAVYTQEDASLDGKGHLALRARLDGGVLKTSFLQTYDWKVPQQQWTTFGPGSGKYIEARINVAGLEAGGLWFAFWLFDPSDAYDGNPATGSEIDIVEYLVSAGKPTSWTKNLPQGTLNHFHVANHWGKEAGQSGTKLIDASAHGVNLRDGGFHSFGVAWQADRLIYYLDHQPVWETRNGVSTSDEHALMLSIEYDQGPGDAWGLDENILDHAAKLPDTALIDHVRVYARKP